MKSLYPGITSILFTLILSLAYGTASAQATRTWVSGVGDDANPCSRTAPCKTWAGAISKTAAGGEMDCLDSGGFGALTITISMTIRCEGATGGVLVSGTNGIVINAGATDVVTLKGLDIDGFGASGGSISGVVMLSGGKLAIEDCTIYGFQAAGQGYGVFVNGTAGAHVLIENTRIRSNYIGVFISPQSGVLNSVVIERSVVDANFIAALSVSAGGLAFASQSTFTGSPSAMTHASGGSIISYGNNVILNAGLPTSTLPLQ